MCESSYGVLDPSGSYSPFSASEEFVNSSWCLTMGLCICLHQVLHGTSLMTTGSGTNLVTDFFFKYLEASIYKLMLSAKRPLYYFSIPKLTPLISFLGLSALAASSSMELSWNSSGHHCLHNPGGKIFSSSVSLVWAADTSHVATIILWVYISSVSPAFFF